MHWPPVPPKIYYVRGCVDPKDHNAALRIKWMKNSTLTPPRTEPATFRLAAQYLNELH